MKADTLKRLALMGANRRHISLQPNILASILGTNPKNALRKLSLLSEQGYLECRSASFGETIVITEKGMQLLAAEYQEYKIIFKGLRVDDDNVMRGRIVSGMGKGQYYISREGYSIQFLQNLGFSPFPGTLNLRLDRPFDPNAEKTIEIEGFQEDGKTFGRCECYKARVQGIDAAIIRPDKSSYQADLVEIVAPVCLRKALEIADGDCIWITLL